MVMVKRKTVPEERKQIRVNQYKAPLQVVRDPLSSRIAFLCSTDITLLQKMNELIVEKKVSSHKIALLDFTRMESSLLNQRRLRAAPH